ncbi:hypothetical protein ACHAQJ_006256 [Trichoderma viride]
MPPPFRLRPGSASDLTHAVRLYDACLGSDKLVELLFPRGRQAGYKTYLYRLYGKRYWSVEWMFTYLVRESEQGEEEVVGFSCWKKPKDEVGFVERWFSLFAWIAPIMRTFISIQNTLSPPKIDVYAALAFDRCYPPIDAMLFADKKRDEWWYLSTLAVLPSFQGQGLGGLLLNQGLEKADMRQQKKQGGEVARGKVWLIGLRGTDVYYSRFGFKEVGRANVGDLSEWDGGIVMFRE